MKKLYYTFSLLFAFTNYSHAILIGDKEVFEGSSKATNNIGACQVYNINTIFNPDKLETRVKNIALGNGILLDLGTNTDALGITAAHCLQGTEDCTSTIDILTDYNITNPKDNQPYRVSGSWSNSKLYDNKKNSADDVGFFHVSLDPQKLPSFFKGDFIEDPLQDQQVYDVRVHSFGPSFNNKLTDYRSKQYHEVSMKITYDAQEKLFYKISKSRDFYFIFSPENNGSYNWHCDLLPMAGDATTTRGDSGSLVTTLDGKALALVSATNFDEFYKDNQKLASELSNFKSSMQEKIFDENQITNLVHFINTEISDPNLTSFLETPDKKKIYRFTLREEFDSIVSKESFTPLAPYLKTFKQLKSHLENIDQEIQTINELLQSANSMIQQTNGINIPVEFLAALNNSKKTAEDLKNDFLDKRFLYFCQLKKDIN